MRTDPDSHFPTARRYAGQPVPDLSRIDPSRWREALAPLSQPARQAALTTVAGLDHAQRAMALVGQLELEDLERKDRMREAARESTALPAPKARPLATRAGRQVNVRLRAADFAALTNAAALLDAAPTQLARTFIINGAYRVLYERRRADADVVGD